MDVPDTVPDTVPRPAAFVPESFIVNTPENELPDCVSCHVIVPGPDESEADPLQVPLTLAGVAEGSVGVLEPPLSLLLQAATVRVRARTRSRDRIAEKNLL